MKWFVLVLALANAGLWFYGLQQTPADVKKVSQGQGILPRVSTLKTVVDEPEGEKPENVAMVEQRNAEEPLPPMLYCTRLGWFEEEADALAEAEKRGLRSEQRVVESVERELPPLHWVLIPPQPPEQARAAFRAIQQRGIDSYLVTEGENSFAISLGLFESKTSAISVLEEKKRQNLNAILAIFPRNQLSYALVFEAGYFQGSEEIRAAEAVYRENFDLVEIRRCEGVATPEKNP